MSDLGWPLRRAASLFGERAAFGVGYRELADRLARLDLEPGARVGVLAGNTRAHAEAWLGVPAAGACPCCTATGVRPLSPRMVVLLRIPYSVGLGFINRMGRATLAPST